MISRHTKSKSRGRPSQPSWQRSRRFNVFVLGTFLISAVLLALAFMQRDAEPSASQGALENDAVATFALLDVGQALSAVIVTEDGYSMVYDFGISGANTHEVLVPFLEDHGVSEIDYAILSHPHQDHLGGLPQLLQTVPISLYIDPVLETTNQTYAQSLELIDELGIDTAMARQGDTYSLGEHVELEILWPVDDLLTEADGSPRLNDNSTVVRADIGDVSILLTGDIERDAERALTDTMADEINVDILQVGHHGSNTSSQDYFLSAVNPSLAAIPVGLDNQYGHPHAEVMQRLRQHDIQIFRTDIDGTVIIHTDGQTWDVTSTGADQSWSGKFFEQQSTELSTTNGTTVSPSLFSTTHSN
jgi:competence protein ComEC